jgi:peptidoglycan/xylan/chitin deacetylase (PgdA/CDA1 family)
MHDPLHQHGAEPVDSDCPATGPGNPPGFSRRGFLALAATLSSCSAASSILGIDSRKPAVPPGAAPVRTTANTGYRTPAVHGPVPRNPDMNLSSDFSANSGLSFSRVLVSGKYIAMTFDDGPHIQNTPRLLDMLRARNIKATFFVVGQCVNLYPNIVRRTIAEGHEIGNHSNTHRLLSKLGDEEIKADLHRCHDAVERAAGYRMKVMRPPYGGLQQRQREMVHAEFGYPIILWSVDPLDWKRPGPAAVESRILSATTPGAIILAHDIHGQTVDAMPSTLDTLLRRGYQFVTVSQLLAMKPEAPGAQPAAAPLNS